MLSFSNCPELEGEPGPELAQHLLVAADRFKLDRLRLLMEQQLCSTLDVKCAAHVLLLADQHNAADLKRAASAFVALNAQGVMATPGWEQLCSSRPKLLSEVMRAMVCGRRRSSVSPCQLLLRPRKLADCNAEGPEEDMRDALISTDLY